MISETLWDLILVWILGAFGGLVVGQFVEPREQIMFCILVGMTIGTFFLVVYYGVLAYKEYKREKKKNKHMMRGGYSR